TRMDPSVYDAVGLEVPPVDLPLDDDLFATHFDDFEPHGGRPAGVDVDGIQVLWPRVAHRPRITPRRPRTPERAERDARGAVSGPTWSPVGPRLTPIRPGIITSRMDERTRERIQSTIEGNDVVLFMKGTPDAPRCGFSATVVQILNSLGARFASVDV